MQHPDSKIEHLLSALRDNFIAEIPERCESIEENILDLEKKESFASAFNELFRAIHSLKGSGGTMGLPIITSISHQFEDLLSTIDGDITLLKTDSIDLMLKYNDLLRSTAETIKDNVLDTDKIHQELEKLKNSSQPNIYSCMLVEQSNILAKVCEKEFASLPLNLTVIKNGMVALERLLTEKYDFLITSKELPVLNGIALICALRKSESKNAKIPCIVTTSKDNPLPIDGLDSIAVVKKDTLLAKNLVEKINHYIK